MKSTGYIDEDGVYHRGENKIIVETTQSTWKRWSHDRQREEHRRDILQPYRDTEAFIEQYPEESKNYGLIKENE